MALGVTITKETQKPKQDSTRLEDQNNCRL